MHLVIGDICDYYLRQYGPILLGSTVSLAAPSSMLGSTLSLLAQAAAELDPVSTRLSMLSTAMHGRHK